MLNSSIPIGPFWNFSSVLRVLAVQFEFDLDSLGGLGVPLKGVLKRILAVQYCSIYFHLLSRDNQAKSKAFRAAATICALPGM